MAPDQYSYPTCCEAVKYHIIWLLPHPTKKDEYVKKPGWYMGQEHAVPVTYCMFCGTKLDTDPPLPKNKK